MVKKLLSVAASIALVTTPALAANPAASLAVASRAGADTGEGSEFIGSGGGIAPFLFIAVIVAGVLTATGTIFDDDDDGSPVSP